MSNEFEVHNFYNHDIKTLKQIKSECAYLCDSAIGFQLGMADLDGSLTKDEWYEKHEGAGCDDDMLWQEAENFFKESINEDT